MYNSFRTFLFRTPYFPFSAISDFGINQHNPVLREMLQIATPDLSESIDKNSDKVQYSTYRYYQRACTRSTPFGLFAGCSMGTVGEDTEIHLSKQEKYKRCTRLDMNYICALTQQIEKERNIREQLYYFPNNSIYLVGNNFRYIEYFYRKASRIHQIAQVEYSDYLKRVLDLAETGTRFIELAATLVNNEITIEEAIEFIHELIDAQVLVSELELAITNQQPLTTLITKLNKIPNMNNRITGILSKIEEQLTNIDRYPIGDSGAIYPAIIKNIEDTKIETEIKYLFQTDMFKPVQQATVSQNIIKDIEQALIILNKINSPTIQPAITKFKENFLKRYEEREMPLLFVLDKELSIGYANSSSGDINPLVDDLAMPHDKSNTEVSIPSIQPILLQKCQQSMQNVIELTDEDVESLEAVWDDLPPTFSVMCQILQDDDNGRSVYIQSAVGQSAANLLGRFCHLDEQILNHTLSITKKESQMNHDVIFAEIVHLSESRHGNILLRPVLRQYEIPYLAKSGVSAEFEIKPNDLYISVKNNRIILRSKRLNKEIIPRMSTAHNYSGLNSMPVYHFLCDIQHQNRRSGLWFMWDNTAQQMDYLPRVVYKNCILSKARWMVREKETKIFIGIKNDDALLQKIKEWQACRNIPDVVLLTDGDNELYIDMNYPLSIRAWLSVVKKRSSFQLEEFLFNPQTAVVHGPEGVFANEFIFAFYREAMTRKSDN